MILTTRAEEFTLRLSEVIPRFPRHQLQLNRAKASASSAWQQAAMTVKVSTFAQPGVE
jgi:succinylarginine dihydrolase